MSTNRSNRPKLSVVVAAWNGPSSLNRCLQAIDEQSDAADTEVVVASNFEYGGPNVNTPATFLELPERFTVPELRRAGIIEAKGEIVALIEDHCVPDRRWCRELKRAHEASGPIVGGSVENRGGTALDWAVYFYDYGKYMQPNAPGAATELSGINVSYARAVLEEIRPCFENGFFETFANEELIRRGYKLNMAPAAIVVHCKSYKLRRATEHCFHLARSYAATRVAGGGPLRRLAFALSSAGLPVLLPARVVAATVRKKRNRRQLIRSLPLITLLMAVWSFGEFCGYLSGAGTSSDEWR